jgi:hypothetical protein
MGSWCDSDCQCEEEKVAKDAKARTQSAIFRGNMIVAGRRELGGNPSILVLVLLTLTPYAVRRLPLQYYKGGGLA